MCGRFTLTASPALIEEAFGLFDGLPTELTPRYNISPTQTVLALRQKPGELQPRYCELLWGLVPSWAKDTSIASRLINARSDGVADKPSFRTAFKKRRCLILADGFYEWKTLPPSGGQKKPSKQPYRIRLGNGKPFAFAGLWESWGDGDNRLESCTIITTDANAMMKPLHGRMPVILDPKDYAAWMRPEPQDPAILQEFLRPCPADWLTAAPVSKHVNNARNEGAECWRSAELPQGE
jgi:putative SOS response-associated peptidase YedK